LERGTGIPGASLQGLHLRLPGHGESGPTLEIFSYAQNDTFGPGRPNRTGFGHIAFQVDDLENAVRRVLAGGGSEYGEPVTTPAGNREVSWIYLRDPRAT
jgi:catechol 2,3-dioxygenase-like lactoylglutathione lyase family enzyme